MTERDGVRRHARRPLTRAQRDLAGTGQCGQVGRGPCLLTGDEDGHQHERCDQHRSKAADDTHGEDRR